MSASAGAPQASAGKAPKSESGKMQQLLALARERLREQQSELAARDAKIAELEKKAAALSAAPAAAPAASSSASIAESQENEATDAAEEAPSRALCQVCESSLGLSEKGRWVLFEYEERVEWLRFESLARLEDYVRRDPGSEPLELPEQVLTVEEARRVKDEAEAAVSSVSDEFRKFRVQAEIQRKQREALHREATAMREILAAEVDDQPQAARQAEDDIAPQAGRNNGLVVDGLKAQLAELQGEFDRRREEEAEALTQLRRRYELGLKEQEKLEDEVRALRTAGKESSEYAALSKEYEELRKEFKAYRGHALKALREQEQRQTPEKVIARAAANDSRRPGDAAASSSVRSSTPRPLEALGDRYNPARRRAAEDSLAKLQYLKNLMLNYLTSPEAKAKEHMERAIATVLAFNKDELSRLATAKANAASTVSSGGFFT